MPLVRVFATADPVEGRLLAGRLESEDIPVLVKGGDAPYHLGPVYLFVPAEDEIRARLFIDAVRGGELDEGPPDLERARANVRAMREMVDADLDAGRISEDAWFESMSDLLTSAYLATDDPRGQSGHGGDEAHWEHARSLLVDAIDRDGSVLDVGCANGYLMESLERWGAARGRRIEPWGVDLSEDLAALARHRLPAWADRIHVGNALTWLPLRRFDFARTSLDVVPIARRRDLIEHLLAEVVEADGRLVIGVTNEDRNARSTERELVEGWGYAVAGGVERPHFHDERLVYRVIWIDAPGRG